MSQVVVFVLAVGGLQLQAHGRAEHRGRATSDDGRGQAAGANADVAAQDAQRERAVGGNGVLHVRVGLRNLAVV